MKKGYLAMASAAAAMVAAPVAANAATTRVAAPVASEDNMGGEGSGLWIALLAAAAVIAGIIIIADDSPSSP